MEYSVYQNILVDWLCVCLRYCFLSLAKCGNILDHNIARGKSLWIVPPNSISSSYSKSSLVSNYNTLYDKARMFCNEVFWRHSSTILCSCSCIAHRLTLILLFLDIIEISFDLSPGVSHHAIFIYSVTIYKSHRDGPQHMSFYYMIKSHILDIELRV